MPPITTLQELFNLRKQIDHQRTNVVPPLTAEVQRLAAVGAQLCSDRDIKNSTLKNAQFYLDTVYAKRDAIPLLETESANLDSQISNIQVMIDDLQLEVGQFGPEDELPPFLQNRLRHPRSQISQLKADMGPLKENRDTKENSLHQYQSEATPEAIAAAEQALDTAKTDLTFTQQQLDENEPQLIQAEGAERAAKQLLLGLETDLQQKYDSLIGSLNGQVPLALLPVRLETRYVEQTGGSYELRVRIYPDDVHQNAHQPDLTPLEITWGENFWVACWKAGQRTGQHLPAWAQLVQQFGAARATYIAEIMAPSDLTTDEAEFPDVPTSQSRWQRSPHTTLMPDRWVVLAFGRDAQTGQLVPKRYSPAFGELIPHPLHTGLSLEKNSTDGSLLDEDVNWKADWDRAVVLGMGVTMVLTAEEANENIAVLLALGVKATLDENDSLALLAETLDAHRLTDGLGIVPQGMPTNNADQQSGYTSSNEQYQLTIPGQVPTFAPDSNHQRLKEALGFASETPITRVPYAIADEQSIPRHMNTVLWPATWGYFLRHIMGDMFTEAQISAWRAHFVNYVRARGPLPVLRAGRQPYGVLPVMSLDDSKTSYADTPSLNLFFMHIHERAPADSYLFEILYRGVQNISGETPIWSIEQQLDFVTSGLKAICSIGNSRFAVFFTNEGFDRFHILDLSKTAPRSWTEIRSELDMLQIGNLLAVTTYEDRGSQHYALLTVVETRPILHLSTPISPEGTVSGDGWRSFDVAGSVPGDVVAIGITAIKENGEPGWVVAYATTSGEIVLHMISPFVEVPPWLFIDSFVLDAPQIPLSYVRALSLAVGDFAGYGTQDLVVFVVYSKIIEANSDNRYIPPNLYGQYALYREFDFTEGIELVPDTVHVPNVRFQAGNGGTAMALLPPSQQTSKPIERIFYSALYKHWLNAAHASVPKIAGSPNPDSDLLRLLSIRPGSYHVNARPVWGWEYMQAYWQMNGETIPPNALELLRNNYTTSVLYNDLKLFWEPRQIDRLVTDWGFDVNLPLVMLPKEETPNYIAWMVEDSPSKIWAQVIDSTMDRKPVPTLLYHLLRHSTLLAYAEAASTLFDPAFHHLDEPELVDALIDFDVESTTPLRDLFGTTNRPLPYGDNLYNAYQNGTLNLEFSEQRALKEHLDSLKILAELFSPDMAVAFETALTETLDLASHRLDAFITSAATRRLRSIRAAQPTGLHIGGYGWVENLSLPQTRTERTTDGFVHAPSINQAKAAAVLLSGYRARGGEAAYGMDLSSERVRTAIQLLDGVRHEQPLGALLGYRFERALHEHYPDLELDKFIDPFRSLAPQVANKLTMDEKPVEAVAARNVVDGLKLMRMWQGDKGKVNALMPINAVERAAIEAELNVLSDAADAVRDVLMAESVYQVTHGNMLRAGASLEALERGETPPDTLEFLHTPRTGIELTHRLFILFSGESTPDGDAHPRAQAEPRLNAWAQSLFAQLITAAKCAVHSWYEDGNELPMRTVTLTALDLNPLDLIYATDGELQRRAAYSADSTDAARIEVDFTDMAEILEVARVMRETITSARALTPEDVSLTGESNAVLAEYAVRVGTAEAALDLLNVHLGATEPKSLREALLHAANFGLEGAVPSPGEDVAALLERAADVLLQVNDRRALRTTIVNVAPGTEARAQFAHYDARMRAVFGRGFVSLPAFATPAELVSAFAAPLADTVDEVIPWFNRAAQVRAGVARLNTALLYAEALTGVVPAFTVGQFAPSDELNVWVGRSQVPLAGRVSMVAHTPFSFNAAMGTIAGLYIDSWTESVPNEKQDTGVVFHYNAPSTQAPQAILLAVPPENQTMWSLELLAQTLLETLDLIRIRGVTPDMLGLGHFLPALYLAFNLDHQTVSTDLYPKED